jgi:hypothetical protein
MLPTKVQPTSKGQRARRSQTSDPIADVLAGFRTRTAAVRRSADPEPSLRRYGGKARPIGQQRRPDCSGPVGLAPDPEQRYAVIDLGIRQAITFGICGVVHSLQAATQQACHLALRLGRWSDHRSRCHPNRNTGWPHTQQWPGPRACAFSRKGAGGARKPSGVQDDICQTQPAGAALNPASAGASVSARIG